MPGGRGGEEASITKVPRWQLGEELVDTASFCAVDCLLVFGFICTKKKTVFLTKL